MYVSVCVCVCAEEFTPVVAKLDDNSNFEGTADEESFAIDNVKLSKIPAGKDTSCSTR